MNNPKILMFGWEFPPYNSGGLGVACLGLTKAMAAEGAEMIFILPSSVKISVDYMKVVLAQANAKVNIRLEAFPSLLYPYVNEISYMEHKELMENTLAYGGNLQEEVLRYASYAQELASREDFDIIHAHDWLTFLAGIEAKKISGKPLVVHIHSTEHDRTGGSGYNQFVYEIEKRGMEQADRVIAISNYTKHIIISNYGIDPDKIVVIHNGIEKNVSPAGSSAGDTLGKLRADGNSIVLFSGRLTIQKGPDYFLVMAKKILEVMPRTIFVIAGSGDMETKLMMQAAKLEISSKIFFLGFLRGAQCDEVYRMADLFVMPSVSEPFGLAALELMGLGTPIIVSKQSGVSEVITHALKVDFWDTDDMANKAIAILKHQSLKNQLTHSGMSEVENLRWDGAAKKIMCLFRELTKL